MEGRRHARRSTAGACLGTPCPAGRQFGRLRAGAGLHVAGTPAAPLLAASFAAIQAGELGPSLGAVVALDDRHVVTCAHVLPRAAVLLAQMAGMDLDGLARRSDRRVFVLSGAAVQAEARRLLGGKGGL